MKHKFLFSLGLTSSILLLGSCQDENFGYTKQDVRDSVYARNFEKMYGEIAEDQTWDFSSYNLKKLGLEGGPSATDTRSSGSLTRAAITGLVTKYNSDPDKWYNVSSTTTDWLNTFLKEKEKNTKYVSSFEWERLADSDPIYVIPIYQGQTGMIWDLELVDLDQHTASIIWSKSQDIRYTQDFAQWDEFFYESYNNDEAPYENNKFASILFKKPLAKVPASHTSNNDIMAAFNVKFDVVGTFYLTVKIDGNNKKIAVDNSTFSEFFTKATADGVVENGKIKFTSTKNTELGVNQSNNRYLTSGNPNKVYLNKLLKTITVDGVSHQVTVDDLKTLSFSIDNYPTDSQGNPDLQKTFYTWSPDRIQVFVKYSGVTSEFVNLSDANTQYTEHHTINKYKVQTRPIKLDIKKLVGTKFAFNLKTTYRGSGDVDLSEVGHDHRSDLGFMSQINHFGETGEAINKTTLKEELSNFDIDLGDTFEYMVVGCEDAGANGKTADQDYNDVVLLIVGKTLPPQTIKKRYMIEDLGATEDFDFNDIVVDVTETVRNVAGQGKKYTQTAAIRHLRGTIPFRVTIGNQTFGNGGIMCGHNCQAISYDPSQSSNREAYTWTHTVTSVDDSKLSVLRRDYWNPDANNIKVEVWPNNNSEDGNSSSVTVYWNGGIDGGQNNLDEGINNVQMPQIVEFPKPGKYPYIIATDQTVQWMDERISIPETWMKTHPNGFGQNSDFQQGTDNSIGGASGNAVPNNGAGNQLLNPTTLPEASIVLNSNPNTNPIIITDFTNIYKGEDIIVHVPDNLYDNSRLVFKTNSDDKTIDAIGVNGEIVVTGDYKFKLTNDMLTKGLKIECEYVSPTKITAGGAVVNNGNPVSVSANATHIQNSSKVIHSYSDGLTISNDILKNLYVGDRIVVHVGNLRANSNLGFKKNTNNWPAFNYDGGLLATAAEISSGTGATQNNNVNVAGDIVLVINKDNIGDIQNGNGLVINGQFVTINSVDIDMAGGCKTITNNHVVTGGAEIDGVETTAFNNDWNQNIAIPSSKFSSLYPGDKVVVHVDNLRGNGSNNSAIGLHQGDWTTLISDVTYNDNTYGNIYNVKGDVEVAVTANNIQQIKNKGLIIQGAYVTVTGVSIVPGPKLMDGSTTLNHNEAYKGMTADNTYYQTLINNIDNYSKLTVYFDQTSGGTINFYTGNWASLQQGINIANQTSYTFDLTDARKNNIKTKSGLLIQYYWDGHTDSSITLNKIVLHN